MKLYHGTDLFSAEQILQKGIDITAGRKGLDFGTGFYVTPRKGGDLICCLRDLD
ncbi:hypothetical protein [Selenomonas ruminantium]|uniref:hypothetical protein n=1 Tax=Selenomonas ruminantium TaxID=971 RepID=UPI0026EC945D|nr:hypothetical protein [Selenomonas ruminantium]